MDIVEWVTHERESMVSQVHMFRGQLTMVVDPLVDATQRVLADDVAVHSVEHILKVIDLVVWHVMRRILSFDVRSISSHSSGLEGKV